MPISRDEQRRSAAWDILAGPRNYLTLIVTQFISSLSALATVWLLTRLLGAGGYGQVAALIAAAFLIATAALNWSAMSLARIGCEEFVETGRLTQTFWTRTYLLALNWLLILATAPFWQPLLANRLHLTREAQFLLFAYLAALSLFGHVQHALMGAKLQSLSGRLQAAERLLILTGAALLFWKGGSVVGVIAVQAVGSLCASLVGLWRLRRLIGRPVLLKPVLLRRVLLFSLPLIPQSLIGYFSTNYLDAWFIQHYLSAADLGVYSIAYQLTGTVMQLPVLVSSLLLPMFTTLEVRQGNRQLDRYMRELLPVMSLGWALAGTLVTGLIVLLLPLVFGEQFAAAAPLMWPLMAAGVIVGPMSMGYGPLLNAKSATMAIAVGAVAGAATNVLLNFLLIPRCGLLGCAWATAFSYLVNLLVGAFLLRRLHGLSGSWALDAVLPLMGGAALAGITERHELPLLLTLALIAMLAISRRGDLRRETQRLNRLFANKFAAKAMVV